MERICELPEATELPSAEELLVPIFMDHTNRAVKSIRISDFAEAIRMIVVGGGSVKMVTTEYGFKFVQEPSEIEPDDSRHDGRED